MRPKNDQKMTILTILELYDNNEHGSMMLMNQQKVIKTDLINKDIKNA